MEEHEDGLVTTVIRPKYMKSFKKKVEYKYAFGQRIPVDFEWKVKQRQAIETSVRKKVSNPARLRDQPFELQYDYNGRRINQKKSAKRPGSLAADGQKESGDQDGESEENEEDVELLIDDDEEEVKGKS